jgi:hypothetical protein
VSTERTNSILSWSYRVVAVRRPSKVMAKAINAGLTAFAARAGESGADRLEGLGDGIPVLSGDVPERRMKEVHHRVWIPRIDRAGPPVGGQRFQGALSPILP